MITEERAPKRAYGTYTRRVAVDVTAEQFEFLDGVRERSGRTLADVLRSAVDGWRRQVDEAG